MRKYLETTKKIEAEFKEWAATYPELAKSRAARTAAFDRIADKHIARAERKQETAA